MTPRRDPEIPQWKLKDGVSICKAIVALRLSEADTLLDHGFVTQAAILLSLATEEFGKAVMLHAAEQRPVRVDDPCERITGFYEHLEKLDAAASFIGGDPISLSARLESLYLAWKPGVDRLSGTWTWNDARIDPNEIKRGIDTVQHALNRTAVEWQ
jgi:hypothetical protein